MYLFVLNILRFITSRKDLELVETVTSLTGVHMLSISLEFSTFIFNQHCAAVVVLFR